MISRRVLSVLVSTACVLTVAIAVVLAVARLLAAMDDAAASANLDRVALALGIVWTINLVCLVTALGIHAIEWSDKPSRKE